MAELKAKADRHAQDVLPIIDDIRAAGISTLQGIAAELNERGILTARMRPLVPDDGAETCWRAPVGCCESASTLGERPLLLGTGRSVSDAFDPMHSLRQPSQHDRFPVRRGMSSLHP